MPLTLNHLKQVARLTKVKDRGEADGILVGAMVDLFAPKTVTLFEIAGPDGDVRALRRVDWHAGMAEPLQIGAWAAWDGSVPLADLPRAEAALSVGVAQTTATADGMAVLLPVQTEGGEQRLLALDFAHVPQESQLLLIEAVGGIYRNFLDLLDYSERDTLTGLMNRKSFDLAFMKAAQHIKPTGADPEADFSGQCHPIQGAPFWLGVVDVDHFKRVNDGFGHLIGDEVLLLVAGLMRSTFRHDDKLYRFGGEEFVVLLRANDPEAAARVFERFRHNVEAHEFPQVGRITLSIGYTQVQHNDTPTLAFERADKVVYLAKSNGRNRVYCYEQQIAVGGVSAVNHESDLEEF